LNQKTMRYVLTAAVAAAVSVPLVAEVVNNNAKKDGGAGANAAVPAAAEQRTSAKPAPATQPVDPNKVVITIGDQQVTAGEFEALVAALPPQVQQAAQQQPGVKRKIADQLVTIKLLAAEAQKQKLDESPQVKQELELNREQVLAQAVMNQASRDYFDKNPAEFARVRARHILIGKDQTSPKNLTDAQAKKKADEVRARLAKGEDFAKLASQESDDPGSKDRGGEYTFAKGEMVPEFEKVAFAQKPGEISQPVATKFGYHIIQTEEFLKPKFEDVKQLVTQKVGQSNVMEKRIVELKKDSKVTLDEGFFGKEVPENPLGGGLGAAPGRSAAPGSAAAAGK